MLPKIFRVPGNFPVLVLEGVRNKHSGRIHGEEKPSSVPERNEHHNVPGGLRQGGEMRRVAVRAHEVSSRGLVPGHFSDNAGQEGHFGDGSHAQDWRVLQRGLAHEAQDHAKDDGAREREAARGAEWKTPFVAALETTEDWLPHRIKLQVAAGFTRFIQIVAEVSS